MLLTLPIRDVLPGHAAGADSHASISPGASFPISPGQAVLVGAQGSDRAAPYSIAAAPEDAERDGSSGVPDRRRRRRKCRPASGARTGRARRRGGPARPIYVSAGPGEQRFSSLPAAPASRRCARCSVTRSMCRTKRSDCCYSARTAGEFAYEHRVSRCGWADGQPEVDDWPARGRMGRENRRAERQARCASSAARRSLRREDLALLASTLSEVVRADADVSSAERAKSRCSCVRGPM